MTTGPVTEEILDVPHVTASAQAQAEPDGWPDGMEMISQARDALGLFAGAMPITPQQGVGGSVTACTRIVTRPMLEVHGQGRWAR